MSSVIELKICAITARIKNCKSIIKKKRKISNDEFILINNVLK